MQTTLTPDDVDEGGLLVRTRDGRFLFYKKKSLYDSSSEPIEIDVPTYNGKPVIAPKGDVVYTATNEVFRFPSNVGITAPSCIFLRWKPVLIVSGERGYSVRVEVEDDLDWAYEQFVKLNPVLSMAENLDDRLFKTVLKLRDELLVIAYGTRIPLKYIPTKLYTDKHSIYPRVTKPCGRLAKILGMRKAKMQGFVFVDGYYVPLYSALHKWYSRPFFLTGHTLRNPRKWFGDFVERTLKPLPRAGKILYNLPIPNPLISDYDHPLYEWREKFLLLPECLVYKLYYILEGEIDKDCLTNDDLKILRRLGKYNLAIKKDLWLFLE